MPLPPEVQTRLLRENDLIAVQFLDGTVPTFYYLRVNQVERPNNLLEFSLGTASALAVAGTDWDLIQDSSNNYYLEPADENYLYQIYWGASPSYIWVYRRFPSGVDRGSLVGIRAIGGREGFISGKDSPINYPSVETELYTVKGIRPQFIGYHPYAEPSAPNVFMSFYVSVFSVDKVAPGALSEDERRAVRKITMGGARSLSRVPSWLKD